MADATVIPFRRNPLSAEMKVFLVLMQPKTRKVGFPIEREFVRVSAQEALADGIKSMGLDDQTDFSYLEIMEKKSEHSFRIAYFDTTRSFSADYNVDFPLKTIKKETVVVAELPPINVKPTEVKPTQAEVIAEVKSALPDEDDYKDSQWYEVGKD